MFADRLVSVNSSLEAAGARQGNLLGILPLTVISSSPKARCDCSRQTPSIVCITRSFRVHNLSPKDRLVLSRDTSATT